MIAEAKLTSSAGVCEQVIVALAHAVVNVEITQSGKHYSNEKLSRKLEEGSQILKAVFSFVPSLLSFLSNEDC